ncbi:hypothetical protein AB1Y20_010643 [Prymnesium parvum]|uniref:EF-hand domain-containing protein n=1 Tax=Prymnesium parvum TaxID=97485 RepID=A0AB34IRZ2_PRYPA
MDACESTAHEAWFLPAVACVAVLVVAVLALLWWWVKRNWDRWYHDLVKKAFDATDTDNDGSIEQDELWAGVLQLYVSIRQQNIPADPPKREDVTALMRNMDTDSDGQLSLREFEEVVKAIGAQAFGRAITMVLFVAVWPVSVGLAYSWAAELIVERGISESFPASILCTVAFIDSLHLIPTLLTILGFVTVVPHVVAAVDRATMLFIQMHRSWDRRMGSAVDPAPLLS